MREDFKPVYKAFIDKYGIHSQRQQSIEEMSELIKELCKFERFEGTEKESMVVDNIKEEIADVLNMLEQLEYFYGFEDIEKIRQEKIDRAKRLYFN